MKSAPQLHLSYEVLGIDLGTTNSVVATCDVTGTPIVLPNADGEDITPSVVYFDAAHTAVVGAEAKGRMVDDPENGVALVKRHMGREFPINPRGQNHTPESISAIILKQLVSAATSVIKPKVVITVPAYFGSPEREATQTAAQIAGLEMLGLLDEPVAAAVHYGLAVGGDRTVLVYDLGGGTFDTTVLRVQGDHVSVIATDGHNDLGGADVDARLTDLVLERLGQRIDADHFEEFVDDVHSIGVLTQQVEQAKRALSSATSRSVVVRTPRDRIEIVLTRDDLRAACRDLIDGTWKIVDRVLGEAQKKGVSSIDDVVMVGGSSRIAGLRDDLAARTGVAPKLFEPDLAVAKGAAIYAAGLYGPAAGAGEQQPSGARLAPVWRPVTISPVVPRGLGILIEDSHDPSGTRSYVEHLVAANTSVPHAVTTTKFGTIVAKQESGHIQIYEQAGVTPSTEVEHNRRVLDGELTGLRELPAGSVIEITFQLLVDGRLLVRAREPRSGIELVLEAFVEGVLDTAESQRLEKVVGAIKVRG